MRMNPQSTFARLALAWFLALAGCTAGTSDNFTNPPPGPPATCSPVEALTGCVGGGLSFSCTYGRPDDGDTNLVCDLGTPGISGPGDGGSGTVLYCCAEYGQWASECTTAAVPGCAAQSIGFACTGETSPDEVDPYLVCSGALAGSDGATDYCCAPFDPSSALCRCGSFDEDAGLCGGSALATGCTGTAIGFTCAGAHTPAEVNPVLDCEGDGGVYCCRTP
jgi:hypothetical protein